MCMQQQKFTFWKDQPYFLVFPRVGWKASTDFYLWAKRGQKRLILCDRSGIAAFRLNVQWQLEKLHWLCKKRIDVNFYGKTFMQIKILSEMIFYAG